MAPPASFPVEQYLLQADEGPSLEPMSSPQTDSGDPFPLPEVGAKRLERSFTVPRRIRPGKGDASAGVSSVLLFESEAGARNWMAYETSAEVLRHQIPDDGVGTSGSVTRRAVAPRSSAGTLEAAAVQRRCNEEE